MKSSDRLTKCIRQHRLYYHYIQDASNSFFGDTFVTSNISDKSTLEAFYAELNARYSNNAIGDFKFGLGYDNFKYGYNSVVILNSQRIGNRLLGELVSFKAAYENIIVPLGVKGDVGINLIGDIKGDFVNGAVSYAYNNDLDVYASINLNSKAPDFNFQLYQSDYLSYNWQNNFKNQQTRQLALELKSKKLGILQIDYTSVDNYLYFSKNEAAAVKPFQHKGSVNYIRAKASNEISFKKFALNNTILYQTVNQDEDLLNLPDFISRNTIYYSNTILKGAMFFQTGFTFKYFSKYY